MLVTVIRYPLFIYLCSFIHYWSFIYFVHCSTIYFVVVCFHFSLIPLFIVVQREKNNSDPEPCSGILIPLYPFKYTWSSSSIQVNKHHTADSTDFVVV